MNESELPLHWRFATAQAFAGLQELVRSFDFLRHANGHTYAGMEPSYLVEVIDGFLGEPDNVVFGGDRSALQQLRQLLIDRIQPVYERGLVAGRQCWHDGVHACGSEELHRLALQSAPTNEMQKGWFAEGFCFAYSFEEIELLRSRPSS